VACGYEQDLVAMLPDALTGAHSTIIVSSDAFSEIIAACGIIVVANG
jgi:hypothetical protein